MDERLEAQASLYALGALPPEEVREFESLLRGDRQLQHLVRELHGTAQVVVAGFPRAAPPAALKARVLAAIESRSGAGVAEGEAAVTPAPGWMAWMPWTMVACFAVLCVVLISVGQKLRRQALALNEQLEQREGAMAELQRQLAQSQLLADARTSNYEQRLAQTEQRTAQRVQDLQHQAGTLTNQLLREQAALHANLASARDRAERLTREKQLLEEAIGGSAVAGSQRLATARVAVLRPTADGAARAVGTSVWLATDQRGLLALEGMPPPHTSQDYQLWLFEPNASGPISAGVFRPDPAGNVRHEYQTAKVTAVERFAVSLEPRGGAARPTGKVVLTSN